MSEQLSSFVPSIPMLGEQGPGFRNALRPVARGLQGVVAAGHYLAAAGGFATLLRGGNAFDAGVAAGLCLNVVQPQSNNFGGVAPIIGYRRDTGRVFTLSGLGRWPRGTDVEALRRKYPAGLRWGVDVTLVPAAPMAWFTCLADQGRLSLAEVAGPAIELAERGFPTYEFYRAQLKDAEALLSAEPNVRSVLCPDGLIPEVGTVVRQPALGALLRHLVEEERRVMHLGRTEAIRGALRAFYEGPIAAEIAEAVQAKGGSLSTEDLRSFQMPYENPVSARMKGVTVYTCGPWCQGPVLGEALAILREAGVQRYGHNSPEYLHWVVEALKLAFADRERYYGDPDFVEVPVDTLVSDAFVRERARLIGEDRAWPEMPPPGDIEGRPERQMEAARHRIGQAVDHRKSDTTYVAAADAEGNVFSATPSDSALTGYVPHLGISISQRGVQSRLDPASPNVVAPWKRPRLTPAPALLLWDDGRSLAFGTPGGDAQPQAMLQFVLNHVLYGQNLQEAVEMPRVLSYSFPNSFPPYDYYPGRVLVDERLGERTIQRLRELGHVVDVMKAWSGDTSVCTAGVTTDGRVEGSADARRDGYAIAW